MSGPVWITPAGFLGTLTERRTISIPVVTTSTGANLTYSIISGQLPTGLYLNPTTGVILGTPVSVAINTISTFVIRAQDSQGISDRTFNFNVEGLDAPVWVTAKGALPVGLNGELYAINQQYVDYTLRAETDVLNPGNKLRYYIADNQGQLPPGLTLTEDGRIRGYVKDNLILDAEASENGGYDTEPYDFYPYEHSAISSNANDELFDRGNVLGRFNITNISLIKPCVVFVDGFHGLADGRLVYVINSAGTPDLNDKGYYVKVNGPNSVALYEDQALTEPLDATGLGIYTGGGELVWGTVNLGKPQVINKTYQFYVTVTDGVASERRLFNIDVVDRNSLRVDNTYLSVDSDFVDSSAGYLLAPIWQSKYGDKLPPVSNLGSVRSSREQILSIYDYDPYPLDGPVIFNWSLAKVNPDIKLYTESGIDLANLPTKNLRGQSAIYFKDAEIIPVKGMQIQLGDYIPGYDDIIYTITGVIKLSENSGILNINQPLIQNIPDNRIFYVGTPSRQPAGLSLDPVNGNIYGKLSYQPSYSDTYRFTVKSIKINQASGDTNLYDVVPDGDARIVGKKFLESLTTSTTSTMSTTVVTNWISEIAPQLIDPDDYIGKNGDIFLVGIADHVQYDDLLSVMGGNTHAFIFIDEDTPRWGYLGETVASNQIYLLKVLGEIPSSIQFISSSSLGTIISGEISELAVKAVNTNTNYSITYEVVAGQLPPGLVLDQDGTIKGKIKNTGQTYFDFGITTATFIGSIVNNTLTVTTVTNGSVVLHQNIVFPNLNPTVHIVGGSGNTWRVSNFTTSTVINTVTNFEEVIETPINVATTTFVATTLSPNAISNQILSVDGGVTTVDQNWYFTVRASDAYRLSAIEQEFYITVVTDTLTEYTRMYVRPFLPKEKRDTYRDFVSDTTIFDPKLIYRPNDPEFGIQRQIKMLLETGVEKIDINEYAKVMQEYFYRKRFYFGEVKSILAQDQNGNNVYEIIYVDIIDDQMYGTNSSGVSVANMQTQLEEIKINGNTILVDERLRPKYMSTLDPDTGNPLGFIKAVPICYTIPGGSLKILSRINNAINVRKSFNFNQFNFDTDRLVVETVKDTDQAGWLFYPTERRILPER